MNWMRPVIIGALALVIWFFGCGGPDRSLVDPNLPPVPRPSHFGVTLPYPVAAWPVDMSERVFRAVVSREVEPIVPIVIQVGRDGRVGGLEAINPQDSTLLERYAPFLTRYRFEPGLLGDTAAAMPLLVDLHVSNQSAEPLVRFPVDPNRRVHYGSLYWRALKQLGVAIPAITRFPSYHYEAHDKTNRWRRYPIKLYRVDLDSTGRVTACELLRATSPAFSDQIKTAVHWGEYTPLRINGHALPSSSFLLVSLYPMVDYPSAPLDPAGATLSPWDHARVRLMPDTLGDLLPPVPKRDWSGALLESFRQGLTEELVSGRVEVDTAGRSRLTAFGSDFYRARIVFSSRAHDISFFPALTLDGTPYPFEGVVYMRYLDASNVRFWFNWLGGSDPGPPSEPPNSQ